MIVARNALPKLRAEWQAAQQRVVFTNGCFDLLHVGHVLYLEEARRLGDLLVLGLNSDLSVQSLKGPQRPLVPQNERATVMAALRMVDYVVIFEETTAESLIAELQPDIYVKGGDYSLSGSGKVPPEASVVQSYGGQITFIPYLPGHSTTALIEKISKT